MAQSAYSRRNVVVGGVAAIGAGVAGYVVANNSSYAKAKRGTTAANNTGYHIGSGRKRLALLAQVPLDGGLIVSDAGVVLVRDDMGGVRAFSATCTHQGCQVTDIRDGQIICPCHGSRFDTRTGAVVAGPAPRPLPQLPVTVEGDTVYSDGGG